MVTAVAVVYYFIGGLTVLFGLASTRFGGLAGGAFGAALMVGGIVIGLIIACAGVPSIIAGYGLSRRLEWGRILALVLAGLAGFSALASAVSESPGYWISGALFIFVFVVLLDPQYKREFGALSQPRRSRRRRRNLLFLSIALICAVLVMIGLFYLVGTIGLRKS